MGQYWKSVCLDTKEQMEPHKYDNGAKIMEHSWLKNNFVQAVEGMLTPKGKWWQKKLVWAGDYMDDNIYIDPADLLKVKQKIFDEYHETYPEQYPDVESTGANLYYVSDEMFKEVRPAHIDMESYPFIVNYDENQYVDKRDCPDNNGWIIHPLPLLTCSGNGRGGGDYHQGNGFIGIWAGDRIGVVKTAPKDYELITPNFIEK